MAQSHRFCDHPATKSARAKCRREREQFGTDYQDPGYSAGSQPPPRQRSGRVYPCGECGQYSGHTTWCSRFVRPRSRTFPRFSCCGNYEAAGHTPWCTNARPQSSSSGHRGGSRSAWDDLFGSFQEPKIVDNENGGWMIQNRGKDREDFARDDAQRDPTRRRIVQLERKAASTTAHEAAACMAAARRLREAAGLLNQAI